jgi:GAF domain-containing protein
MTQIDADVSVEDAFGLAAGLAGLSGLVAGSGTLEQLLTQVATFTVRAVPGADGAGVTMLEKGEPDTVVASAPFVRDVDVVQYRLGEGPCVSAASTGRTAGSAALGEDGSWPTFGPLAAQFGVHSALSLPLVVDGEIIGALNVYAHHRDAFPESARHTGELFAAPAAVAVHNARLLAQMRRMASRLQVALTNRATIDQAIGIIRSRLGVSSDDASAWLRLMSDREHVKLSLVAAQLVQEAVRDAHAGTPDRHE